MIESKLTGQSLDIVAENVQKLKTLFPEIVTEDKIDFEKLQAVLGKYIDNDNERYNFTWHGKSKALRLAQTPSTGTLRPCKEESKDWETTQNLYIEGDNLETLKLLQKAYHNKIKMIYIDPPYNTGKDFVYSDDYKDNLENYLKITGQKEEDGGRISTNSEANGRYHTNWLNMIYPRLRLARNLLRDDGIIFISIDDAEVDNLKKVCNEIFGEINFVACLVWDKNRKNDAKYFSVGHEYMLVYFKSIQTMKDLGVIYRAPKEGIAEVKEEFQKLRKLHNDNWELIAEGLKKLYASWDEDDERKPLARFIKVDEKGPYRDDGNISWPGGGGPKYEVIHPITKKPCKIPDAGWRFPNLERMQEEIDSGRVVFGPDETTLPRIRRNLFEADKEVMRSVHFSYAQTATMEFNKIFDNLRVFENPKHFGDIKQLIQYITTTNNEEIILDFFSGSATTAHAVMQLNAEDGGNRRFIMVQLPEPCGKDTEAYKAGYKNICEIGKERIRRAGEKIIENLECRMQNDKEKGKARQMSLAEDNSQFSILNSTLPIPDVGFKVFKLDSSNLKKWNPDYDNLETSLEEMISNYVDGRTELDVVYEIMLKYGIDLTLPVEEYDSSGKKLYSIGFGALVICLDDEITKDIAADIIKLKKELNPETMRVVFKDNGFKDDATKTNVKENLKQAGIEEFVTV
jgi:adenine-specific DNA-methyltransferase